MLDRTAVLLLAAWVAVSCAPAKQETRPPPPPEDPIRTSEQLAHDAERNINSAEHALDQMEPDKAVEHLDAAYRVLINAKMDNYPDAAELRSRHKELLERVPVVREEVRKRDLAAAVQEARNKIDAASASLTTSLAEIKKKRPEEAELKMAEEAVAALEAVLNEATKLESEDKEYSKYAAGVRKGLVGHKKTVNDRRIQVSIDISREQIDAALKELDLAIKDLRRKDVEKAEFDAARAAADKAKETIEGTGDLITKDRNFAKQVANARRKVEAQRDWIGKREHEVAVERQKASVELAKKTLTETINRLKSKDVVEGDFNEADAAANSLEKLLTEGGSLAAKDPKYASYSTSSKAFLLESKSKIEARKVEVAVAKQKAEIEAARIALGEAMFRVNGKTVAEGEFTEASNAIGVVEKALDAAEPLTGKDRDFSRYVLDVRKGLQGARAKIEQRKLDVAVAAQREQVNDALANLKSAMQHLFEPEEFKAAEDAIATLEKVLDAGEQLSAKDRNYSKFALEARRTAVNSRRRWKERHEQVTVDNQKAKVSAALETMRTALDPLEGFSPGEELFTAANQAIEGVKKALEEGAELEATVGRYKEWTIEPRKKVEAAIERVERRRTQITVRERKLLVGDALQALKSAVSAAKKKNSTSEHVKEAEARLGVLKEEISKGTDLEIKDHDYRRYAAIVKKQMVEIGAELDDVKQTVAFREGPVASLNEGLDLTRTTRGLEPEDLRKAYATALEHFKNCQQNGATVLAEFPRLANQQFQVTGGKPTKAKDILGICAGAAKSTQSKLASVEATLAFYTGPAKGLEIGKNLLADAEIASTPDARKKTYTDALTAFERCIEQGKTLEHKQPELKKRKFDLEGKKVTLALVIAACQKGAKTCRESLASKN